MKFIGTVGDILRAAINDKTPKAEYQFVARDSKTGLVSTCLFGGALLSMGIDATKLKDHALDAFIDLGDEQVNLGDIGNAQMVTKLREKGFRSPVRIGTAAMALNDSTGFSKQDIAAALLDAMTPEQIEKSLEVDLVGHSR